MHEANQTRAAWARNAVDTFGRETYGGRDFGPTLAEQPAEGEDAYTMIQDLIGDLLHLAVRSGWDADELLRRAKDGFDYESNPDYQGD